jgi:hypothetical protein
MGLWLALIAPKVPAETISTGFTRPGVSDCGAAVQPGGKRTLKPCSARSTTLAPGAARGTVAGEPQPAITTPRNTTADRRMTAIRLGPTNRSLTRPINTA